MQEPEGVPAAKVVVCSKCGLESPEGKRFCSRCGFPYASVFKQPVSTLQSLEPAIKFSGILFGINLLFLAWKVTPKSVHLPIEIAVQLLFCSAVLFAVYPIRSKIHYLCRRFFNRQYSSLKMMGLGLATAVVILGYFAVLGFLGVPFVDFLDAEDIGTAKVPWEFISVVLLAPIFEEMFFRGYLFQKLRLVLKPRQAIILQGLLFGIIHLSPAAYISHTIMGILAGFLRYRTQSLLPGMVFHASWNLSWFCFEYWRFTI